MFEHEKELVLGEYETKIRVIVYSEMDSYLKGERDLETTCKMIQSRVQLMLDEGK